MFALEIGFQDGVSQPEMIFIRRPQGLIGSSDTAHVVIEDLRQIGIQIRLFRDLGRKFRCKPVSEDQRSFPPGVLDGTYDGQASIDLGPVRLFITSLDFDLILKETEPPDRAGVRVLRQACANPGPLFPAVVVRGTPPMVVSFVPDNPIYIGRSKQCALRLDQADISARHARLGYEGGEFWVEDLGSTNGTFVNQQQISGRVNVAPGSTIILGRDISIAGVATQEQLQAAAAVSPEAGRSPMVQERKFPILVSMSEVARPQRLVLSPGMNVTIGREPGCEMWLGAPHVSRKHCVVSVAKNGTISIQDSSTNGTAYDRGVLRKGEILPVMNTPQVLDFGGGVTVAVCFDENQERDFTTSGGAVSTFARDSGGAGGRSSRADKGLSGVKVALPGASSASSSGFMRPKPFDEDSFEGRGEPAIVWRLVRQYLELGLVSRLVGLMIFALLAILFGVLIHLVYGIVT